MLRMMTSHSAQTMEAITQQNTIFKMLEEKNLYITPPGLIYFIAGSLDSLTPFSHFTHPDDLPASGNHQSGLYIHEYASLFKPRNNSIYFPFLSSFPTQSIFLVKSLSTGKRITDSEISTELFS